MRLRNSATLLVTRSRQAHRPALNGGTGTACNSLVDGRRLTYIQAVVWVQPSWCFTCFPSGMPQ